MIWDPIERLLWGIAIALLLFGGIIYIVKGRKRENSQERLIMYGFASFLIGYAFDRIFRYLSEFFISGTFKDFTFYGDYSNPPVIFEILRRCAYISLLLGFSIFLMSFERIIKHTRYIITLISLVSIPLFILLPFEDIQLVFLIYLAFGISMFLIILLLFTKWSEREFKAVSALILLGFVISDAAYFLSVFQVKTLNLIPLIIPPILSIIGIAFMISPMILNPDFFSKNRKYWTFIISISIIVNIIMAFIMILIPLFRLMSIAFFFIIYLNLRILKLMTFETEKEREKEHPDILAALTKPQKVTEEEVTVSKEKKICLVCKGKVIRFNSYICVCDALYCEKCALALIKIDNACWACNAPIDESKPVRLTDKRNKEIIIESADHKETKKK
ncbi:MAG: hypothetical protein ACFFDK_02610 [Promethearchaeota archaeon]